MSPLTKRLSWALAISLGLNLFLLGFGSSRWLHMRGAHGKQDGMAHGPHEHGAWHELVTPELRAQHRKLSDARRAVGEVLRAQPYDAPQLEHALGTLRTTTSQSQELLHQRLLEQAPKLSPEQRGELANSRFFRAGPALEPTPAP